MGGAPCEDARIDDRTEPPPSETDWVAWHRAYDDPGSVLSRRLVLVRSLLADALDAAPAGPVRLLSLCAGDGRDVLGVLPVHPRGADVEALLVERDERLADAAREAARGGGLEGVTVAVGDAGRSSWFAGRPLDVVLCCGIFGNVTASDLRRTIEALALVVAPGGSVLWTRHRRPPDQTPAIRKWFEEAGFDEVAFRVVHGSLAAVGWDRRGAAARHGALPTRLFEFIGDGSGAHV